MRSLRAAVMAYAGLRIGVWLAEHTEVRVGLTHMSLPDSITVGPWHFGHFFVAKSHTDRWVRFGFRLPFLNAQWWVQSRYASFNWRLTWRS